jgi:aspartate-semialdehyde dehydrogenase
LTADGRVAQFDLAVLGADDPLGESFLQALEEGDLPVGRLYPLVLEEAEGIVAFRGEEWPCLAVQEFDFAQVQILVSASPLAAARRVLAQVRAQRPDMPIWSLEEVTPAPALAVGRVLKVLSAFGSVLHAEACVTLPAALAGKAGVDELVNQSRGLFNLETPDPEVFPLQIAFNVIPLTDDAAQRYGPNRLAAAVQALQPVEETGFMVAWTPLLFGAATALHVRFAADVEEEDLRRALLRQEGICLMASDLPAGNPTPATDSAESADIFLGQVRAEGRSVRVWLVYDPLRLEAGQMVTAVENWIDTPRNSVLT